MLTPLSKSHHKEDQLKTFATVEHRCRSQSQVVLRGSAIHSTSFQTTSLSAAPKISSPSASVIIKVQ